MKKDLLYKPHIKHSENFYSDNEFQSSNKDIDTGTDILKIDKIEYLYDEIKNKAYLIPNFLIDAYFPPLLTMEDEFKKIIEGLKDLEEAKEEDKNKDKDEVITDIIPDPDKDPDIDIDIFDKEEDVYIEIPIPDLDVELEIEESYMDTFIEIYEDYLIKLNDVVSEFVIEILEANKEGAIDFAVNKKPTLQVNNPNIKHLTDYMIKSDIYLSQNVSLHRKLFTIDESIFHIKAPKLAKEQLKRYKSEEKLPNTNRYNNKSNTILKESILISEKKYIDNTRNLYKYLNSQVMLLDESLNYLSNQLTAMISVKQHETKK